MQEWYLKHPAPWDMFATFERAAGVDLDWFWSSYYYETWVLDHAVAAVVNGSPSAMVTIEDRGFIPMPATVRIDTTDGGTLEREIPVSHWLSGETSYTIELPASVGDVKKVVVDPEALFPDIDRNNNSWPMENEANS